MWVDKNKHNQKKKKKKEKKRKKKTSGLLTLDGMKIKFVIVSKHWPVELFPPLNSVQENSKNHRLIDCFTRYR